MTTVPLGELIRVATSSRAGLNRHPILSMTMHDGLVDQSAKFRKQVASQDLSDYKVVLDGQLVVGFPIDEGVLDFQTTYQSAIVSPAYGVWDVIDDSVTDRAYLGKFLRSARAMSYYKSRLRGSTARRRSLPRETFLALPVPFPSLREQRRIADILDQAGALCTQRRRVIGHLDSLAQSIFREMFESQEWPVAQLADVVQAGTTVTYGIVQAGPQHANGVPYIRTGDISAGRISTDKLGRTSPEIADRFPRSRVSAGDIVMSIRATVGTTAIVPAELDGANLTQGTARISPGSKVSSSYLLEYLRSAPSQRWIGAQIKGATFREITLRRLRELEVPLPPVSKQSEFDRLTTTIASQRSAARQALFFTELLFSSLQSRAFRGEL